MMRSWQKNFRSSVTPSGLAVNVIIQTKYSYIAKKEQMGNCSPSTHQGKIISYGFPIDRLMPGNVDNLVCEHRLTNCAGDQPFSTNPGVMIRRVCASANDLLGS
jgi:hypothetical protein